MKVKTFDTCKDEVAVSYGYKDWSDMVVKYDKECWDIGPVYTEASNLLMKFWLTKLRKLTRYNKNHDQILYNYQEAHEVIKEALKTTLEE